MGKGSVVQDWMAGIPWMQQTVVLTAIRGCDGSQKNDPTKTIVRLLRSHVLNNAGGTGSSYMDTSKGAEEAVKQYLEDCDAYPLHFAMHLAHAAEIIGYKHPDRQVREFWSAFYHDYCHTIHLNPETMEQMDKRLQDGRDEEQHGKAYNLVKSWASRKRESGPIYTGRDLS